MIGILSDSFQIATRTKTDRAHTHWKRGERFDNRRDATLEAQRLGHGHV